MYKKPCGVIITMLFTFQLIAQSPSLSVKLKMDSCDSRYLIEMKICSPLKGSPAKNIFSRDTSHIDLLLLSPAEYTCGAYFKSYNTDQPYNYFEFSNQLFGWEKIIWFQISNVSSRGWHPPMFIVIPIKYKAFVTHIEVTGIVFKEGKIFYVDDFADTREGSALHLQISLKGRIPLPKKDNY